MDLQGIGALAAAAVAALGVPAAVVVGRWQMRGAIRTAEETARAGMAQADATYRAALDTVRAETSAALNQRRRSTQREAYVALLLASHRVLATADLLQGRGHSSLVDDVFAARKGELSSARAALLDAQLIVTLEGNETVVNAADSLTNLTFEVALDFEREADMWRAWNRLQHMHDEAIRSFTPDPSRPDDDPAGSLAHDLMAALALLGDAVTRHASDVDYRLVDDAPPQVANAIEAVRQAFAAFPPLAITLEERKALLDMQCLGLPTRSQRHERRVSDLKRSRRDLIDAARDELNPVANAGPHLQPADG